jgi:hypothetical protein
MKIKKTELADLVKTVVGKATGVKDITPTTTPVQPTQEVHYLLYKFPQLKKTAAQLFGNQYNEFIESIEWIVPRPTTFKLNLKNGEHIFLKWEGKSFQAQIQGKRYMLELVGEFEQALDKLSELLKYNPIKFGDESEMGPATGPEEDLTTPPEVPAISPTGPGREEEEAAEIEAIPTT